MKQNSWNQWNLLLYAILLTCVSYVLTTSKVQLLQLSNVHFSNSRIRSLASYVSFFYLVMDSNPEPARTPLSEHLNLHWHKVLFILGQRFRRGSSFSKCNWIYLGDVVFFNALSIQPSWGELLWVVADWSVPNNVTTHSFILIVQSYKLHSNIFFYCNWLRAYKQITIYQRGMESSSTI